MEQQPLLYPNPNEQGPPPQSSHPQQSYGSAPQGHDPAPVFVTPSAPVTIVHSHQPYQQYQTPPKSRIVYIILALFFGLLGVHNFYVGRVGAGVAQLLITIFIGWLVVPLVAVFIWVIVEICAVTSDGIGQPMAS
ncbi:hypothetical protein P9112_014379 [Eukaryota sp. TZLM1-RC]